MGERRPSLLSPADDLTQILGPDLAKAFLDHRKMLKKPMTAFAGQLMARKLRGFPDPVAAIEQSILRGWADVFEVKAPSIRGHVSAHGSMAGLFGDMEEYFGSDGQAGSDQAAQGTLLSLPFDGSKH